MNEERTITVRAAVLQAFRTIRAQWPRSVPAARDDLEALVDVWCRALNRVPGRLIEEAVLGHVAESQFAPRVADILARARALYKAERAAYRRLDGRAPGDDGVAVEPRCACCGWLVLAKARSASTPRYWFRHELPAGAEILPTSREALPADYALRPVLYHAELPPWAWRTA